MNTLWIGFIAALVINLVLATLDYLSTMLGSPLILMVLMVLATIGLGAGGIAKAPNKKTTVPIVVFLILISNYKIAGMLFAMVIWGTKGFSP